MSVMQITHGLKAISSMEMRRIEKINFKRRKSFAYMKNAGHSVARFVKNKFTKEQLIVVLCGPGNNGGDGFVTAKHLLKWGYKVQVFTLIDKKKYRGDAKIAIDQFYGDLKKINQFVLKKKSIVIDALFGIGLKRNIKGKLVNVFSELNKKNNIVISVDIPSGICADTGKIFGKAIKADYTITFHSKKKGLITKYGKKFSGKIKVADIGFNKTI